MRRASRLQPPKSNSGSKAEVRPARFTVVAIACGVLAVVTLLAGVYGWRADSAAVLLLTATPMFAVLALAFGLASRRRASADLDE